MRNRPAIILTAVTIGLAAVSVFAQLLSAKSQNGCASEKLISSKLARDLIIALTNEQGKLNASENAFCLSFRKPTTGELADVQSVSIEFSLLVGKIQEEPIMAQLARDGVGQYSGRVDLGRLYYHPASYYVFVRYLDLGLKKRKVRIHLSVK